MRKNIVWKIRPACFASWLVKLKLNLTSVIRLHTVKWWQLYLTHRWDLTSITNQSWSGPGRNDNKDVLHIPQSTRTESSPSDGFVSYIGHSLKESHPSAEMQSANSSAPAVWAVLSTLKLFQNIQADYNSAVVWMVSNSLGLSSRFLRTVLRARIMTSIIITFTFHNHFSFLAKSRYLSYFLPHFFFTMWSVETAKSPRSQVIYFYLINSKSCLQAGI